MCIRDRFRVRHWSESAVGREWLQRHSYRKPLSFKRGRMARGEPDGARGDQVLLRAVVPVSVLACDDGRGADRGNGVSHADLHAEQPLSLIHISEPTRLLSI